MTDPTHLASDRLSTGLPVSAEIFAGVISDRIAGMEYPMIASKYGIHHGTARRIARRAIQSGLVTADQVAYKPVNRSRAMDKETYDAQWVARVKANCIVDSNGCWLWQGFLSYKGYGNTNYRNRSGSVHRRMFQIVHGVTLKTEEFVCHRCDVRRCCNPDHLWLGDAGANNIDSRDKGTHYEASKIECHRGHPFNEENTYMKDGARACKACARGRQRVKAGWPVELAYSAPAIPQDAPTERRRFAKRKAA